MLRRPVESAQFTSSDYQRFLADHHITSSMSEVGHCGDNAAAEGFFGMLKRERVHRRRYLSLVDAKSDVFDYIERFHNPRMQRRLDVQDQKFYALTQPSAKTGWNPPRCIVASEAWAGQFVQASLGTPPVASFKWAERSSSFSRLRATRTDHSHAWRADRHRRRRYRLRAASTNRTHDRASAEATIHPSLLSQAMIDCSRRNILTCAHRLR